MKRQTGGAGGTEPLEVTLVGAAAIIAGVTNDGTFATPANQTLEITALNSIDGKLPAGGLATSAKQDTGNTSLGNIDTKTLAAGQAVMASSSPVVIASNQSAIPVTLAAAPTTAVTVADGADVALGTTTDAAIINSASTGTLLAFIKGIVSKLTSLITALGSPFQAGGSIGNTTFASTIANGANVVEGTTTDAKVITDATGTIQQYLRGLVYLMLNRGTPPSAYSHVNHLPAVNTKATITKAAGGGTVRNVCKSLTVSLSAGATAPAAIQLTVALIDGATGGSTYLWGPTTISLPATAGATAAFVLSNVNKIGSQNTAMTLEFSAAGGANTYESVEFDCEQIAA